MKKVRILWADDEIDLLKVQVLFLEEKGYEVITVNNGFDALQIASSDDFNIIFLDENMPGMSGIETLYKLREFNTSTPVVMITKNEEEDMMDEAIGSKISDYLIKPVNPKQILLTIKKNVDDKRLITEKTSANYRTEFGKLGMMISDKLKFDEWKELYRKLVYWDLELEKSNDPGLAEIIKMQKNDANLAFNKYIKNNYTTWFSKTNNDKPLMSPQIFRQVVFPQLEKFKTVVIIIDNLRYDQWKVMQPQIEEVLKVESDELYLSILPTATQYARNAIMAGLMPLEISKLHKDLWTSDDEDESKNNHEDQLLATQLNRNGIKHSFYYDKVSNTRNGKKITETASEILQNRLSVIVYNFIDMLSHARTDTEMVRELVADEASYRSLTSGWFKHSYLLEFLKEIAAYNEPIKIIITTDHGTVQVANPIKVIGDRDTTTNLRYKQGRNLNYKAKEVFEITKPETVHLPSENLSSSYIFAGHNDFFAYPNNYNHYVRYYKNTFQHGGVSLEEMLIPIITLNNSKV